MSQGNLFRVLGACLLITLPGCLQRETLEDSDPAKSGVETLAAGVPVSTTRPLGLTTASTSPAPFVFTNGPEFPGATGSLQILPPSSGDSLQVLSYDFSAGGRYVASNMALPAPVSASFLSFSVAAPLTIRIVARVLDESGQTLQFQIDRVSSPIDEFGWSTHVVDLTRSAAFWGGRANGILNGRVRSLSFIVDANSTRLAGQAVFRRVLLTASSPVSLLPVAQTGTVLSGFSYHNGSEFPGAKGGLVVKPPSPLNSIQALAYDFTRGGNYVSSGYTLPTPAGARYLRFATRAAPAARIALRVVDQSGQTLQFFPNRTLSFPDRLGWSTLTTDIASSPIHWGGANDGNLHGGVVSITLIAEQKGAAGTAYFRDIELHTTHPEFTREAISATLLQTAKYTASAATLDSCVKAMRQGKTLAQLREIINAVEKEYMSLLLRTSIGDSGSQSWVTAVFTGSLAAPDLRRAMLATAEARLSLRRNMKSVLLFDPVEARVDACIQKLLANPALGARDCLTGEFVHVAPLAGPGAAKPVGVNDHGGYSGLSLERVPLLQLTGTRMDLTWTAVQTKANGCALVIPSGMLSHVTNMAGRGLSVLGILDYGNEPCGYPFKRPVLDPAGNMVGEEIHLEPATEDAFLRYVAFVASNLKLRRFELWNEWDVPLIRAARELARRGYAEQGNRLISESAQAYVRLLQRTFATLQTAAPGATLFAGVVDSAGDYRFLDALVKAGVMQYSHGFSVHIYNHTDLRGDAEQWAFSTSAMAERIRKLNGGREFPMHMTELGWPGYLGLAAYADLPSRYFANQVATRARATSRFSGMTVGTALYNAVAAVRAASPACTASPSLDPALADLRNFVESNAGGIKAEAESLAAGFSARAIFLASLIPDLRELMFYDLGDDGSCPYEVEHNFGLVARPFNERINKPAAVSVRDAISTLTGKRFLGRIFLADADLFALRFAGADGAEIWALWSRGPERSIRLRVTTAGLTRRLLGSAVPAAPLAVGDTELRLGSAPLILSGALRTAQLCALGTTVRCAGGP